MELNRSLKTLIDVAQKVIPKSEYGKDKALIAYTHAILPKISKTGTFTSKEYAKVTVANIKYGFMSLYVSNSDRIEKKDLGWILEGEPSVITIAEFDRCAYPLSLVYRLASEGSDPSLKRKVEGALFTCFAESLGDKQVEKKDAMEKILDEYKDVLPELKRFFDGNDIDIPAIMTTVEGIMNRLSTLSPPDMTDRKDVITAVIETLQKVEHDKELNANLSELLKLAGNEKLMKQVPKLLSKFMGGRK